MGAAHLSLCRVGWASDSPLTLRFAEGIGFQLACTSPALLGYTCKWRGSAVSARLHDVC